MDSNSLKRLTTEEKAAILAKEVERVEGRIGEFLALLAAHYPQGLTRSEIKTLLAVNNNESFVSLYRNGNIFIDIEKRYSTITHENRFFIGMQFLHNVQCFRRLKAWQKP